MSVQKTEAIGGLAAVLSKGLFAESALAWCLRTWVLGDSQYTG